MCKTIVRTCYIAVPLYICGFVLLGASFQKGLSVGVLVMGWGIAEVATMINTVAVCELLAVHLPYQSNVDLLRHRCVLQRLLPAQPRRDIWTGQLGTYAWWLLRGILPGPMGDKAWCAADIRGRGRDRHGPIPPHRPHAATQGPCASGM